MNAYSVIKASRRDRFAEVIAGLKDYTAEELDGELLDLYEASRKLSLSSGGPNSFLTKLRNMVLLKEGNTSNNE